METKIENGFLVVRIPVIPQPRQSSTGKTLVMASTGGFKLTDSTYQGKPVSVNLTATLPNNH